MAVPTQLSDLSVTAASNSPAGTDTVGTTMDDYIRAHASIIARISAGTDVLATPALGTPASGVLTNCTGLPTGGLANDSVTYAKMQNVSATNKLLGRSTAGSGDVEEIACTAAGRELLDDADATAQRTTLGLTELATTTPGTNVATALGVAVGSAGAVVVNGGALGTPSSGTLSGCSGLSAAGVIGTALTAAAAVTVAQGGTGRATSTTAYGLLAAGTTATGAHQTLAAGATTEVLVGGGASALPVWTTATGSGAPVRATSPTLVTPILGTPQSGDLTSCTGTATGLTSGITNALKSATTTVNVSSATAPSSGQVLTATGSTAATWQTPSAAAGITLGTMEATTTGKFKTRGSIPAGTKRIMVMFDDVSLGSGATPLLLRLGDSGGLKTTGYVCYTNATTATDGFLVTDEGNANDKRCGIITLCLMDSATNKWVMSGTVGASNTPAGDSIGGVVSLSGELTQVGIATTAGTADFDGGNWNISYE